jgi:hypothetical protein
MILVDEGRKLAGLTGELTERPGVPDKEPARVAPEGVSGEVLCKWRSSMHIVP